MNIQSNKSVGGKNKMILALMLFNEGKSIEKVIKSFHHNNTPIYDYLAVSIDNKTSDNTYDVVRQFCPESNIMWFDFNNDFGGSRNKLLKECEKIDAEWVFMPDGHEVLREESKDMVKWVVEHADKDMRLISPFVEIDPDEHGIPKVLFNRPMFFRNKENIFFQNKAHNYLYDEKSPAVKAPEIILTHVMPEDRKKVRGKQRKDMNIKVLREKAEKGDVRDIFYLGNTYAEMGDFENAIEWYEKSLKLVHLQDRDMAAQTSIALSACYIHTDKWDDVRRTCFKGIENRYDRAELYFYLGLRAGKLAKNHELGSEGHQQYFDQARHWFTIATTCKFPITNYFLQTDVYTWKSWSGLMESLVNLNDLEGGLFAANKVKQFKPTDKMVLQNIKNIEKGIKKRAAQGKSNYVSVNKLDDFYKRSLVERPKEKELN